MIRCKPGTDYTITGSLHPKTTTAQRNSSHRLRRANPGWSTPPQVATTPKRSVQSNGFEFRMSYTESVRSQATPSRPGVTTARRHRGANEVTTTQPRPSCARVVRSMRRRTAATVGPVHATPSCPGVAMCHTSQTQHVQLPRLQASGRPPHCAIDAVPDLASANCAAVTDSQRPEQRQATAEISTRTRHSAPPTRLQAPAA